MRQPPGDEDVLVGEGDRGPAVELGDQPVEAGPGVPAPFHASQAPQDARGAPDALQRPEQEPLDLSVHLSDRDEGELLDVSVELLVLQRQAHAGDQLTELIELGRFQRDGITRLDVHRVPILVDGRPRRPVGSEIGTNYPTIRPSRPASGGGICGSSALEHVDQERRPRRRHAPTCDRRARRTTATNRSTSR